MIYKILSEENLPKGTYIDSDGDWWKDEQEHDRWENNQKYPTGRFSVIEKEDKILGNYVTNEEPLKDHFIFYGQTDEQFKKVYNWVMDFEITKETHPEYFL